MAAGKQGSDKVIVTIDDASGAPQIITGFVMDLGGAEIEMELESSESFGKKWREKAPTGMWTSPPIGVKGHFDTTTVTGPHVVLRPNPNVTPVLRTVKLEVGDSTTFTVEAWLNKSKVAPSNGKLTGFEATLTPSGEAVWS
jgi:hypothetical protein